MDLSKLSAQFSPQELLNRLRKLDRKSQAKLLGGSIGALLSVIFIFWPAWIQRPQIGAQSKSLRGQIEAAQTQVAHEPQILEERKRYEDFIRETHARLLTEGEIQTLLGLLAEMAEKSEVTLTGTYPEKELEQIPPPFDKKYTPISYTLTIEGGYHALAAFVSQIENYAKNLRVDSLSINSVEDRPLIHQGEVRLSAFSLHEELT